MQDSILFFTELNQTDLDWIFETGKTNSIDKKTNIIKEGTHPDGLFFILKGLVGIYISHLKEKQLSIRGPGEILGEISFLEDQPATASVEALENTQILTLPRDKLKGKLEEDAGFGLRFYRSLAIIVSKRLRESLKELGGMIRREPAKENTALVSVWERLSTAIDEFKEIFHHADQRAMQNNDVVPVDLTKQVQEKFLAFCYLINEEIGDQASGNVNAIGELGKFLQRELLPYLFLTRTAERSYTKPRGYAGDYLTIEYLYQNQPEGSGRLGPLLDQCFLNLPVAKAVRNRRSLLSEKIMDVISKKGGETAEVTSLACGPAEEIFDVFSQLDDPTRLRVKLLDMDFQALAFVSERRDKMKLKSQIKLLNENLIYLAAGREKANIGNQDLVYSIGLIDYFNDKFVIALLRFVHEILRPGGKVILGNFHPRNPTKALLDYILDWELIHRTEEDMNRLFSASVFDSPCTEICFEDERINLFAECVKR